MKSKTLRFLMTLSSTLGLSLTANAQEREPAATAASREALEASQTDDGPLRTWPKSSEEYQRAQSQAAAERVQVEGLPPLPRLKPEVPAPLEETEGLFPHIGSARFNFGMGYVFSRWSQISSEFKNGSLAFQVGSSRQFSRHVEAGVNFLFLSGSDNSSNQENIYSLSVSFDARYYLFSGFIKPYVGLGLGFGSFRAWSLRSETPTSVIYAKHAGGYLVGSTPSLGIRIRALPWMSVDLAANYVAYFTTPAYKAGGLGVFTILNFVRR